MNKKALFTPLITLAFLFTSCWGGGGGDQSGWESDIKQEMNDNFGMLVPYVDNLEYLDARFYESKTFHVDAFFDDIDSARTFIQSYDSKLMQAGFDGDFVATTESITGRYFHTTSKTEGTLPQILWIDIDVASDITEDITFDLIAYLSPAYVSFPNSSLCELVGIGEAYKDYVLEFATRSSVGYRIKGYVPGDTYHYVIAADPKVDDPSLDSLFDTFTQLMTAKSYNPVISDYKATGQLVIAGLGTLQIHCYEEGNMFYGGYYVVPEA